MSASKRFFDSLGIPTSRSSSSKRARSPVDWIPTGNSSISNPSTQSIQATGASHSEPSHGHQAKLAGKTVLAKVKKSLNVLQQSCGVFEPVVTAAQMLQEVVKLIEEKCAVKDSHQDTATGLAQWATLLTAFLEENQPVRMSTQMENLTSVLRQAADYLRQQAERGAIRPDEWERNIGELERIHEQVEEALWKILTEASLNAWKNTDNLLKESLLNAMLPVHDAVYDSSYADKIERGPCLKNTRVGVLDGIRTWIYDLNETKVYWINGMAGTGKTTIAYSVCEELAKNKRLGASFFVSRASSQCQDVSRILPTIAYQLARVSYQYRSTLCRILDKEPNAAQRKLSVQFEHLIESPLRKVAKRLPKGLVVVIDALDECSDPRTAEMVADLLLRHAANLPVWFFLTSRPDPSILDMVLFNDSGPRSILHLHNVEEQLVQSDIKTYLSVSLARLRPTGEQIEWLAGQAGVLFIYAATLVRYVLATGLGANPTTRLRAILAPSTARERKKDRAIDQLYKVILEGVLLNEERDEDEVEVIKQVMWTVVSVREPVTKTALAALIEAGDDEVTAALGPLQSVIHVFGRNEIVSTLHASFPEFVLNPSRSGPLSCDQGAHNQYLAIRCFAIMKDQLRFNICGLASSYEMDEDVPDIDIRVQEAISSALFYACRYWAEHLTLATVCDANFTNVDIFLKHRLLFWMEVLNLKGWIKRGKDVLVEASNWLLANQRSNTLSNDCLSFLTSFAQSVAQSSTPHIYISHLPLGLKGDKVRQLYLERARGLVQVEGTAVDARLVGSSNHAIKKKPSDNSPTTVAPNGRIHLITFSPSGNKVATWSEFGTISIWDSCIGSRITRFRTGEQPLTVEIMFSPDERRLIYFSSGIIPRIMVWDVQTGTCVVGPIKWRVPPRTIVLGACFSPDSARIAVTTAHESSPKHGPITLTALDLCTGKTLWELFLPDESPLVDFSLDGSYILSSQPDGRIQIWNSYTGTRQETRSMEAALRSDSRHVPSYQSRRREHPNMPLLPCRWYMDNIVALSPKDRVECTYFQQNPPGSLAVSKLVLRDRRTKELLTAPFGPKGESITAFSFSPDGTHIFSASGRGYDNEPNYTRAWRIPEDLENNRMKTPWEIDEDGWVRDQDTKLIICVPAEWRHLFPLPPNTLAIGLEGSLKVSMDNLLLGEAWTECYDPNAPPTSL